MHEGQIDIHEADARRWTAAERLLSLPPDVRIMRYGDLAWLDPLPTFEWYQKFYNKHYLARDHCRPYDETPTFVRRRIEYFASRIERINKHLGRKPESLLEIGSGDGQFLVAARSAAIEAIGVEISESSRDESRERYDVDVLLGDLIHTELPIEDHYDVVVMNHVLEHLVTPLDYLGRIHGLLGPDGLLAIEIPQQFINPIDLTYRCLGKNRRFGAYSLHHPYFYNTSSIRRLMEAARFEVLRLETWLPRQIFHVQNRLVTKPVQAALWVANKVSKRGHVIEVFARPI